MPISHCYQLKPDGYVRFEWHGKPMEGEFYQSDADGADSDPYMGYIRPFDRALRQQLVDNLQIAHGLDLLNVIAKEEVIGCDAFVTRKQIQAPWQVVIERLQFIAENDLLTDKDAIRHCRADVLQRQFVFGSHQAATQAILDSINTEYLRWVTPLFTPLRYHRTGFIRHRARILGFVAIAAFVVLAYACFR